MTTTMVMTTTTTTTTTMTTTMVMATSTTMITTMVTITTITFTMRRYGPLLWSWVVMWTWPPSTSGWVSSRGGRSLLYCE